MLKEKESASLPYKVSTELNAYLVLHAINDMNNVPNHIVAMPMVIENLFHAIPTRRIGDSKSDWNTNGNFDTMSSALLVRSNQGM
jgi:hypothetical protein